MPPKPPRKILVLELWGIGDLTFSTVLIRKAVEAGETVHVLAKPHAEMLLKPTFPSLKFFPFQADWTKFIHKYWLWNWNWRTLFSLLWRLRREHYDAAVSVRDDPRDHLLMWLIGAKRRFGFPRCRSEILLNAPVARSRGRREHKVEDWRDLAAAMGYGEAGDPELKLSAYRSRRVDEVLKEKRLPVLVVHTGARIAVRRWPLPYYEALIGRLRQAFRFYLILIADPDGSGSELAPLADAVLNDLTLEELTDVVGRADLVLANDSGPGHIAASCGTPVISFSGPGADWIRPWGPLHRIIRRDNCPHRPCFDDCRFPEPCCMTRLTPATVWPEVEAHLCRLVAEGHLPKSFLPDPPAVSGQPFVAAVVATYKRPMELARLLQSLKGTPTALAVMVVDNAGDAATAAAVEAARGWLEVVRVVPGHNLGCGGGLAYGEEEALKRFGDKLTHFWIMDDDAEVSPGVLESLLTAMDQEKAVTASPMVLNDAGEIGWFPGLLQRTVFNAIRTKRVRTPGEYREQFGNRPVPFSWATGVSLLVERGAVEAVGLHRTDFLIRGEDIDFSLRLTAWGKGIYVPNAEVRHLPPSEPATSEAQQSERRKHAILVQNVAFISLHLRHGRRILRTLPGNFLRYVRTWGLFSVGEALAAFWTGAVQARPAGCQPQPAAANPAPAPESALSGNKTPMDGSAASSPPGDESPLGQHYRILQIFNRYLQYGGEEGSIYRIGEALMEQHDVEYYLQSTSGIINDGHFADKLRAMYSMIHNQRAVKDLRRMQEIGQFHFWQIHNIFPTLSPSVYKEAFRLGVPILHYLHNYRMGCINGFFLDHGEMCQRCIKGNFIHSVKAKCWHDSRLACGWMTLVMARIKAMDLPHNVCRWVAISEAQKAVHVEMGIPADRIDVVHHFYEASGPAFPLPTEGYALFLGRLSAEKGCMDLLKAWRTMPARRKLVIAGDGPELPRMLRYVADHGLTHIKFMGFVPKEKQEALWRGAAFLVVPSVWLEPFGMVVLEAWACGRTVVAYSIGALPEIITDGCSGLLVKAFDTEALAATMERLFSDDALLRALSSAARSELETRFSKDLWRHKINAIYHKVLTPEPNEKPQKTSGRCALRKSLD